MNLYKFPIYLNFRKPLFPKGRGRTKKKMFFGLTIFSLKNLVDSQMMSIQKKSITFGCVVVMLSQCLVFSVFLCDICAYTCSLLNDWKVSGRHPNISPLNISAYVS